MKQYLFFMLFLACSATLSAQTAFPQDFESITNAKGDYLDTGANFAAAVIADNPLKEGINTSDKVVAVTVGINSGIIRINFKKATTGTPKFDYPAHPEGLDELYYDVLRFKYYTAGKKNKFIELAPNGNSANPKILVEPTTSDYDQKWAYVEIPLAFKEYANFQMRINSHSSGSGSAQDTQNGDKIYVDDFEVYNSDEGPTTSIPLQMLEDLAPFQCVALGNGEFRIEKRIIEDANLRFDLISIDGKSHTVYDQYSSVCCENVFKAPAKGLYVVRMLINGKESSSQKVLIY